MKTNRTMMVPRAVVLFALFLAAVTFSPRQSSAFTVPAPLGVRPASPLQRPAAAATTAGLAVEASTVVDAPSKTKEEQETKTVDEILKDDSTEEEKKYGGEGWEIRLFNDPVNKREFVAMCLSTICGKSDTESYQIMMQAHNNGYVCVCVSNTPWAGGEGHAPSPHPEFFCRFRLVESQPSYACVCLLDLCLTLCVSYAFLLWYIIL